MRFTHHTKLLALGAALAGLVIVPSIGEVSTATGEPVCGPVDDQGFHQISTASHFQSIGGNPECGLDKKYVLVADITLSEWLPIGADMDPFTGVFEGNGRTIDKAKLDTNSQSRLGLFAVIGESGVVQNLVVRDADITSRLANSRVGALAGENRGTVLNVRASGKVTGTGASPITAGGLVGFNTGTITNSHADVAVAGQGRTGGLVGRSEGESSHISNSYATGDVNAPNTPGFSVGGLVGSAQNTDISRVFATGDVTNGYNVGGLIGAAADVTVRESFATGIVTAGNYGGGLLGEATRSSVADSYAWGDVSPASGSTTYHLGGVIGSLQQNSSIDTSYSLGKVTPGGSGQSGGLVGLIGSGSESSSFWNTSPAGQIADNGFGEGKTATELKELATFAGWAIVSGDSSSAPTVSGFTPWAIGPSTINGGYPYLLWETCGPLSSDGFHEISTASQLKNVGSGGAGQGVCGLGANYRLMDSINLVNETGWVPLPGAWVGPGAVPAFDGTFDGNRDQGFSISNLKSVNEDVKDVGLFAVLGFNANVFNLNLEGFDIKPRDDTAERVGALAGRNWGSVSGVQLADSVVSNDNKQIHQIGGLIGDNQSEAGTENHATVEGSSVVSTNVTGSGTKNSLATGGVVGRNTGTKAVITDSHFWGGVVTGHFDTGGVVGVNQEGALVDDVFFSGTVAGSDGVGGVAAENSARVTRALSLSLSEGAPSSVTGGRDVGGLVGRNLGDGQVTLSYSGVNVLLSGWVDTDTAGGGLVGTNEGSVADSYASGSVTIVPLAPGPLIGGLVGRNAGVGSIVRSYSIGDVKGDAFSDGAIGNLISGSSSAVFFDRDTTGVEGSPVGRRTTEQMTTITTFSGWDIAACATPGEDTIWGITAGENDGYPFLRWEAGFELSACPAPVQTSTQTTNPRPGGQAVDPEQDAVSPHTGSGTNRVAPGVSDIQQTNDETRGSAAPEATDESDSSTGDATAGDTSSGGADADTDVAATPQAGANMGWLLGIALGGLAAIALIAGGVMFARTRL